MRLASVVSNGQRTAVRWDPEAGGWRDLGAPLEELLASGGLTTRGDLEKAPLLGPEIERVAPLLPRSIIAVGLNYRDHAAESGLELPERPLLFAKLPGSVIGPGQPIEVDAASGMVDWEVELAAVIGTAARDVPVSRALDHVIGWTVVNDVSDRELQKLDGQWLRGKSLDTFCPLGPEVVGGDELGDPSSLSLWTEVNGERLQDGNTAEMVHGPAALVSWISSQFTLHPGDLILTGTPAGVGIGMTPPRSLRPGDVVSCGVEGIGSLSNPVVARSAA